VNGWHGFSRRKALAEDTTNNTDAAFEAIKAFGLGLPEAVEEHPWGETALKVRRKSFVFLGHPKEGGISFSVKLPRSAEFALLHPFAEKTGYGLGKANWIRCRFTDGDDILLEMLFEWVAQSYRAVAPKKLAALVPDA